MLSKRFGENLFDEFFDDPFELMADSHEGRFKLCIQTKKLRKPDRLSELHTNAIPVYRGLIPLTINSFPP